MSVLTKDRTMHLNKYPLGDSNKTDWKGLEQYLRDLQGKKKDKEYALREVGNIFPNVVPEIIHDDSMPNHIPRIKDTIAVQWKGTNRWEYYGRMNFEERMAVLKRYNGATWQTVNVNDAFKYYDGGWIDIKTAKYYDGADWISFYTIIPVNLGIFRTATTAETGWTNRSATLNAYWIRANNTNGIGVAAATHGHAGTPYINFGVPPTPADYYGPVILLYERVGAWQHGPHSSVAHTVINVGVQPTAVNFRFYTFTGSIPNSIPADSLIFWSGTTGNVPTGWSYISTYNNYRIKVLATGTGNTGMAKDPAHSMATVYSGYVLSGEHRNALGSGYDFADFNINHRHSNSHTHAHTFTAPYFNVIIIKNTAAEAEIPVDGVASCWGAPAATLGTAYTRVSAADNRLLNPTSSYGGTGGVATHLHDHVGKVSNSATLGVANTSVTILTLDALKVDPHSHSVVASGGHAAGTNFPLAYDMYLYERTA